MRPRSRFSKLDTNDILPAVVIEETLSAIGRRYLEAAQDLRSRECTDQTNSTHVQQCCKGAPAWAILFALLKYPLYMLSRAWCGNLFFRVHSFPVMQNICWRFCFFLWLVVDTHSNLDGFFFYFILLCTDIMSWITEVRGFELWRAGFRSFTDQSKYLIYIQWKVYHMPYPCI